MRFYDTVKLTGVRITDDGYLVGDAPVARTGVQVYAGHELGMPDKPIIRLYRPPEEVFSQDSMRSYAHRPVTVGHPQDKVTADNWKDVAAGQTGDEVVRDGDLVRVPLVLMDAAAIRKHGAGVRELSMGYDAEVEFVDGTSPEGEPYDAIQRNLRMNHLALVARARGGDRLRLGDDTDDGGSTMTTDAQKLRTVTLDGLPVETTDAGAKAIERLLADIQSFEAKLADAEAAHAKALEAKDAEIAKLDAQIDDLKSKILTDAQLDERAQARADLLSSARRVADIDYSGKSDDEVRRLAVAAKLGDQAVADRSDAYINARFDILLEDAEPESAVNSALRNRANTSHNDGGSQAGYEDRISNAWRTGSVETNTGKEKFA